MTSHTEADLAWFPVQDAGSVGTVRRAAAGRAASLGLPEKQAADLAIVATELATNLYKYGEDGVALVRAVRGGDLGGVEIVAIDKGPGMADLSASMKDGHSTHGTLGIGLGAIVRGSTEFDAYSWPGSGTVIAATVWAQDTAPPVADGFGARGISRPMSGELSCGDGYGIRSSGAGRLQLMLCDGLGHGGLAAVAAQAAESAFREAREEQPKDILEHIHRSLNHTRGAVVTVVDIDHERGTARYAGLGNVSGVIIDGGRRRTMAPQPGIAGHRRPALRELELPCPPTAVVVLHSDGVNDRWKFADYPGLTLRTPLIIAATLLRDAGVRRDDAAVLVAKAPA